MLNVKNLIAMNGNAGQKPITGAYELRILDAAPLFPAKEGIK